MSAAVGDIGWWTALRQDQRERIDSLRAVVSAAELSPIGVASIEAWINEADQAWSEIDAPGVEYYLELAAKMFAREHRWVEP